MTALSIFIFGGFLQGRLEFESYSNSELFAFLLVRHDTINIELEKRPKMAGPRGLFILSRVMPTSVGQLSFRIMLQILAKNARKLGQTPLICEDDLLKYNPL